jgi:hypothetical protein
VLCCSSLGAQALDDAAAAGIDVNAFELYAFAQLIDLHHQ